MSEGLLFQAMEDGNAKLLAHLTATGEVNVKKCGQMGTSAAYLAVLNDQPHMMEALHKLEVDLEAFCDPENFGTPLFYAIQNDSRVMVEALYKLGVDFTKPCDLFGTTPAKLAWSFDNRLMAEFVEELEMRKENAATKIQAFCRGCRGRRVSGRKRRERDGASVIARFFKKITAFRRAAKMDMGDIAENLMKAGDEDMQRAIKSAEVKQRRQLEEQQQQQQQQQAQAEGVQQEWPEAQHELFAPAEAEAAGDDAGYGYGYEEGAQAAYDAYGADEAGYAEDTEAAAGDDAAEAPQDGSA